MTNGISVAQSGIDISQAQDSQKVADSRWKYLEIAKEVTLSFEDLFGTGITQIYKHSLGFPPLFTAAIVGGLPQSNTKSYSPVTNYIRAASDNINPSIDPPNGLFADDTYIMFRYGPSGDMDISNKEIFFTIYNVPILEEYMSPVDKTAPTAIATNNNFGVETAVTDVGTSDLRDYTLSTRGKGLAIQRTGTIYAAGVQDTDGLLHNLGYPPSFIFVGTNNEKSRTLVWSPDFFSPVVTADTNKLRLGGAQSVLLGTFGYVILKDLVDFGI